LRRRPAPATAKEGKRASVLFVCRGNICRSPTAEGVFRKCVGQAGLDDAVHIDSAGTQASRPDSEPDSRARAAAERRGYSLDGIRARRVTSADLDEFDHILAMDGEALESLREMARERDQDKITLLLEHSTVTQLREVPDPYYGGDSGFEDVLDLVEGAARGLLVAVRNRL